MPFSCQIVYGKTWERYLTKTDIARSWLAERTGYVYQHLAETYKLGKPVPLTINKNGETDVKIRVNGINIVKPYFDGMFFSGRDFAVEASGTNKSSVTGWKMTMTKGGETTVTEVNSPDYAFIMPECDSLALETVDRLVNGISDMTANGDSSQQSVTIYDLMGRQTHKPAKGIYIERRGGRVRKIAHNAQ